LQLRITLGVPLIATEGYAAPNVGHTYTRARELCRKLGQPPEIAQVLWGLWTFHLLKGELATARGIAEEFLRLATHLTYPGLALRGHWAMEITFMHMGEFELAMEHFEKAIALYDPERHRDDAFRFAQNPGVAMRCFAAISLWFLGQPDRGLNVIQQAVTFARELSEPHGLAHALFFAALLHQLRREEKIALDYAEDTIAVSEEHEMVLYRAMARVARGWALNQQGRVDDALEEMREGLAAHHATGTELLGPHFLALLAEALGKAGQAEEGILLLDRALTVAARTGEQYYQAEVHRLRGELLLTQKFRDEHAAAECFYRSIEAARRQRAKSLELRAAMSLVRLYQDHSGKEESRGVLAQICDGFTEGFDTADLREAKALFGNSRECE
jgi:predicted ATPase